MSYGEFYTYDVFRNEHFFHRSQPNSREGFGYVGALLKSLDANAKCFCESANSIVDPENWTTS